jgi:long-chain acyl-CoA synthetase
MPWLGHFSDELMGVISGFSKDPEALTNGARPCSLWICCRSLGSDRFDGLVRIMLVDVLLSTADRFATGVAVDDGVRALRYRDLVHLSLVLRRHVERVSRCERVGILLPSSAAFPAALFGVLWASRVAVPLNFLLSPEELNRVVADADLDVILTTRRLAQLAEVLPARALYLEDLPLKRGVLLSRFRRISSAPKTEQNDTAVILYTSGTTAEPKGVELTHGNLHSNSTDSIRALGLGIHYRFLQILPPFHVFGLTACVLIPVFLGAPVYAIPRFSPPAVVRAVRTHHVSVLIAIPSMYAAILRAKSARPEAFASVELAVSGGEPLPDTVRAGFEEKLGVVLLEGYGLTETSPVVAACRRGAHKPGTVGRPIPNVEIRIAPIDAGPRPLSSAPSGDVSEPQQPRSGPCARTRELAPAGIEGEILVRGPGVMKGYFRKPDETRRVIDADGWFHTGDIGRFDEEGFLSITGRIKDMLIIGGENVYAREIESVLESHPAVLQAAVIGARDELRGEVPVAFVVPKEEAAPTEEELRTFVKQSLAGFKVPRRIVVRSDLPTGPTGKILKRRLKELL